MTVSDLAPAPDFPVEWLDPTDADVSWEWDDMHMPFALAPLAGDYIRVINAGMAYPMERFDLPFEILLRIWNGYAYFGFRSNVSGADEKAAMRRALESRRAQAEVAAAYWRDEALPELHAAYDWIAAQPVETLDPAGLAEAWLGAWQRADRAWQIHFYAIRGPYQVMEDLADLYESIVENASPAEAMRLIQGSIDELQDVERELEALAVEASARPAVAGRIVEPPTPSLADLAALEGGHEFVRHVRRFLDRHGHLGQGFDDLALASWAERPQALLDDIAKRVRQPGTPADERRMRLAAEADELADAVRARLADRPGDLERFEALLARSREIGRLTETHNYWIDRMAQARLRTFVMRVGRRLADAGVIDEPADILFLHRAEVPDLVVAPSDRRRVVAERRALHARRQATRPPSWVGKPPDLASRDRFDGQRFEPGADGTLRGTGASAGVARGTARLVLGPQDFERVQPGDIIVAPSSNPSWVPLFAIAGGLATNTGGVLSHAAVVAREFGLPAVVGATDATTRIADGRLVEIDGTAGTVRLL